MAAALPAIMIATTVASAGASILGGIEQSRALKFQAKQAETQARLENLRAKEQANQIRNQLNADLASANATFAARGVLSTSGSADDAKIQSIANASRDIDTAIFGGKANAGQLRSQANQLRSSATAARVSGFINAATTAGKGAASFIGGGAPSGSTVVGSSAQTAGGS